MGLIWYEVVDASNELDKYIQIHIYEKIIRCHLALSTVPHSRELKRQIPFQSGVRRQTSIPLGNVFIMQKPLAKYRIVCNLVKYELMGNRLIFNY